MTKTLALGLAVVLLGGCASAQRLEQNGATAVTWPEFEIKFMRDTPQVEPRECPISMLQKVRYLKEQTWPWHRMDKWFSDEQPNQFFEACPPRELKLDTWTPVVLWVPSPFRTAAPGVSNLVTGVAAAFTLGKTMPRTEISNNNSGVNLRASTLAGEVPGGVPR